MVRGRGFAAVSTAREFLQIRLIAVLIITAVVEIEKHMLTITQIYPYGEKVKYSISIHFLFPTLFNYKVGLCFYECIGSDDVVIDSWGNSTTNDRQRVTKSNYQ